MFKKSLLFLLTTMLCVPSFGGTQAIVKADLIDGIQTVKNYVRNPHAEKNTNGWIISKNTSATAAPDSGFVTTSTSNTIARSTSSPLAGDASFLYTLAALGNQVCAAFSIDSADTAKVLQGKIEYAVASGTYTSGDATIWIYDVTNAAWIQPAPYEIPTHALTSDTFNFEFQSISSSTSYKVCIHQAAASTAALKIDNIFIGRAAKAFGSPVTDWVSYTPTVTVGSGDMTGETVTGLYRRVGSMLHVKAKIADGGAADTYTGVNLSVPSICTIDSSLVQTTEAQLGHGTALDAATALYTLVVHYNSSSTVRILWNTPSGGTAAVYANPITQAAPFNVQSGDSYNVEFMVPCLGWGATTQMSTSADTRVVTASALLATTGQTIIAGSDVEVVFNSERFDTHDAFSTSTGRYTVKVPGRYRVTYGIRANMGATAATLVTGYIKVSGGSINYGGFYANDLANSKSYTFSGSAIIDLQAGQYVSLFVNATTQNITIQETTSGNDQSYMYIERISGPTQIAANETIHARYSTNAGATITNATTTYLDFEDKETDTHGIVSGTGGGVKTVSNTGFKATAPVSGLYYISFTVKISDGALVDGTGRVILTIFKNGGVLNNVQVANDLPTAGEAPKVQVSALVRLNAGDYIEPGIYQDNGGSRTLSTSSTNNTFEIARIGL